MRYSVCCKKWINKIEKLFFIFFLVIVAVVVIGKIEFEIIVHFK